MPLPRPPGRVYTQTLRDWTGVEGHLAMRVNFLVRPRNGLGFPAGVFWVYSGSRREEDGFVMVESVDTVWLDRIGLGVCRMCVGIQGGVVGLPEVCLYQMDNVQ